jgi:uroporphyrin-III C-methyltransferase
VRFVGAGPGDPELITVRGLRALHEADAVLYDSLVSPQLLEGLRAKLVYVGKRCGRHAMTQEQINQLLVDLAEAGEDVVRLKGGDPAVLGRVGEEILPLAERGIEFEIIPGVSSATAVPALAGIPVTHRDYADSFTVATAHRREESGRYSIPPYQPRNTLVLLMAGATVPAWTAQLLALGYPPDLPVAFVSAGCTPRERVAVTAVAQAEQAFEAAGLETPVLAVVGWVVALREALAPRKAECHEPSSGYAFPRSGCSSNSLTAVPLPSPACTARLLTSRL